MDETDWKIVKLLNVNSRYSNRKIAEELQITPISIKRRIDKIIEEGVILSFEISFDSILLGLNSCLIKIVLSKNAKIQEVISRIKRIEKIYFIIRSIDNTLISQLYYTSTKDLENNIDKIRKINDVKEIKTIIQGSRMNDNINLSKLDWKIINNLNHNARKKTYVIAKELDVNPKTIRRRIKRLLKNNIIFFTVDIDFSKAQSYFPFIITVKMMEDSDRDKISKTITQQFETIWGIHGRLQTITTLVFLFYARRFIEIEDVLEKIKLIPGVKIVNSYVYISCYRFNNWFDNQIKKQINKK